MLNGGIEKSVGKYIYWSEGFENALRKVLVSLRDKKKYIALTGEKGVGKTEIFNLLDEGLTDAGYDVHTLDVSSSFTSVEFLTMLAGNLDVVIENQRKLNLLQILRDYYHVNASNSESILLIDNCNRLESNEFLEDLRYIVDSSRDLQIILLGEPEFIIRFNSVFSLFNSNIEVIKLKKLGDKECPDFVDWLGKNFYSTQKKLQKWTLKYVFENGSCNIGKIKLLIRLAHEVRQENNGKLEEEDLKERWEFLEQY